MSAAAAAAAAGGGGGNDGMAEVDIIIDKLLTVRGARPGKPVQLAEAEIRMLCLKAKDVFMQQSMLLELEAPIKICGDIHGQYYDLLRLFEYGGFPPDANYLFLGYVANWGGVEWVGECGAAGWKEMDGWTNIPTYGLTHPPSQNTKQGLRGPRKAILGNHLPPPRLQNQVSPPIHPCSSTPHSNRLSSVHPPTHPPIPTYRYPENFFILRGNHECASINRIYGFYDECKRRYNIKLWKVGGWVGE